MGDPPVNVGSSMSWVGRRRVAPCGALFRRPPSEPDVTLSRHPALQWLFLLARFPTAVVGVQMAGAADHEGLTPTGRHDLYPLWLFPLAFDVQVAKGADVVDFDIHR